MSASWYVTYLLVGMLSRGFFLLVGICLTHPAAGHSG